MPDRLAASPAHRSLLPPCFPVLSGLAAALLATFWLCAGSAAAAESAAPEATTISTTTTGVTQFRVIGTDGAALRLRETPTLTAEILARLPEGTVVKLRAGSAVEADGERWLPVQAGSVQGWSAAQYLTRVVAVTPIVRDLPSDAPFGQRAAAVAESALGKPYVWSANGPGAFDCSGFVQWVYSQAGLKPMARLIPDQLSLGTKIEASKLERGDLVAFKNTYRQGLSHIGVYLGENRFVSAVDEAHGVSVSTLADEYWKPRFYAAVRLKP